MKTLFSITFVISCLGALQWGFIGLGGFIGKNLNIISRISQGNSLIEYSIYMIIGVSAVVYIWLSAHD